MDSDNGYVSSPCMLHEFEEAAQALHILYLHIAEDGGGVVWQVHLHDVPEPLAVAASPFASDAAARDAGQVALDKACGLFRRFSSLTTDTRLSTATRLANSCR